MGVILKNMIKNVCANKRRSIALVLCMSVVGFCAMFSLSIQETMKNTIYGIFTQTFGDAEIIITNPHFTQKELDLPDGTKTFYIAEVMIEGYTRSAENFMYPTLKMFPVLGMDIAAAQEKGFIQEKGVSLGENEIIITEKMAQEMNYETGSVIRVEDPFDNPISLTVAKIIPNEGYFKERGACAAANMELVNKIKGKNGWENCYVKTNGDIDGAFEYIKAHNSNYEVQNLYEGFEDSFQRMIMMFTGIFIVIALIILFISAGMSEHIIRERMSELGTLRSLGATKMSAAIALILENLFYGLTGAALGILFYIPVCKPIAEMFFSVSDNYKMDLSIHASSIIIALVVTALISCLSAIRAILRAVKIPVRDIIFGNQNTAYTLSYLKSGIGVVLLIVGILFGMLAQNAAIIILGVLALVAGLAMALPALFTLAGRLLENCRMPVIRLALKNTYTKKMIVSSVVLYAVVAGLMCAILMLVAATKESASVKENTGDIIITDLSAKTPEYSFIDEIDGVAETEIVYKREEFIAINGQTFNNYSVIVGFDKTFSLYQGVQNLPDTIGNDEVILDQRLMDKLHILPGDNIELVLNAKGKRPISQNLTVVAGCDTKAASNNACNGVVISLENYKRFFYDYPAIKLVRLDNPERTRECLKKINTYMMDKSAMVYTAKEYEDVFEDNVIIGILYLVVLIGCTLMLILLTTNQSISFEQRRREFAILHSTAMSRMQLKKMLLCEMAVSLLTSTVAAFGSGIVLYHIIMRFVSIITETSQETSVSITPPLLFLTALLLIALLIVKRSVRGIDRMNTASQIKYE